MLGTPIDTTLLKLDQENTNTVQKAMCDIQNVINMGYQYMQDGVLTKDTAALVMKTIENAMDDMSVPFEYQSARQKEQDERLAMLRSANQRVRELETQLGQMNINNPDAIKSGMLHFMQLFQIWYEACGFHYASVERISEYGYFTFDFSTEVETERDKVDKYIRSDPELGKIAAKIYDSVPHLFGENSEYNLVRDGYRCEILGSENNQTLLTDLFKRWFPKYTINNFNLRRNDYGSFSIRLNITISLHDIAYMVHQADPDYGKTQNNKTENKSENTSE